MVPFRFLISEIIDSNMEKFNFCLQINHVAMHIHYDFLPYEFDELGLPFCIENKVIFLMHPHSRHRMDVY